MKEFFDAIANVGEGGGAAILVIIVFLYFQSKKDYKGNGNGNSSETKAREMGSIISDLAHVKSAVDELKMAANQNQLRIGELAGNVNTLTHLITKHFKI